MTIPKLCVCVCFQIVFVSASALAHPIFWAPPDEGSASDMEPAPASKPGEAAPGQSDEPGQLTQEEPSTPTQKPKLDVEQEPLGNELQKAPGEPEPPSAPLATMQPVAKHGIGLRVRGLFLPGWLLGTVFDANTALNSTAFGVEWVRHKGNMDMVGTIDFGFYSLNDGNFMSNGKNPATEVDYIQFRNLNLLALGVDWIWHRDITHWLSFVYGGGVGIGVVLGDVFRVSNANCTPENMNDINACYPKMLKGRLNEREAVLAASLASGKDTPDDPHLYPEDGLWPVVPVLHLLVGVNFKLSDSVSVRADAGFHNAFYLGAAGHYYF